ncbi:thioredoxin family protein [Aquibacillus sp. 3ASR75-11]|uniref:Thioredoxin family protein n=1 Tax=Terrihalobacillus insolitus TaxID=2950438 RepID=A0A9X3WVJ4_9BACI|nr:thioredoxin family protein [Terrihalobacillus insolitus]MDC3425608.1 thioredoxin family protein [Terrihalobacillus insolitus]
MKRNMIIFTGILILLFGALAFVINYQNKKESEGNPYNKPNLNQATIDQLDNELYQNQILPDELKKKLENNEDVTVYFYSPTCIYCQRTTPIIVPLTQELGVDMKKFNLLEFEDGWETYGIEGTPTIVRYENGEEVARISGEQPKATFKTFFNENVLKGDQSE